jgi:hypothetical protein
MSENNNVHNQHLLVYRRILLMVRALHLRGYERLRAVPGLSPSGCRWRCGITPASNVCRSHGALEWDFDGPIAQYTSRQDGNCFGWTDAEAYTPEALAGKFIERFPEIAEEGYGPDPDYAAWYAAMLDATTPGGLIYAYADWELPSDRLLAIGVPDHVVIPLPPPGE